MEAIFTEKNILEFINAFPDDTKYREAIAKEKWKMAININVVQILNS